MHPQNVAVNKLKTQVEIWPVCRPQYTLLLVSQNEILFFILMTSYLVFKSTAIEQT